MRSNLTRKVQTIAESVAASYRRSYPFMDLNDLQQMCYVRWMEEDLKGKTFETEQELAYLKKILSNHLKDQCKDELKHQEIRKDLDKQAKAMVNRSRRMLGPDEEE